LPDVTGDEFQVFISLLSKLKTFESQHDQLVDLIAEQAELENEPQVSILDFFYPFQKDLMCVQH
jgi:O-phosphoseryl-tRNA(Cys) synthetase